MPQKKRNGTLKFEKKRRQQKNKEVVFESCCLDIITKDDDGRCGNHTSHDKG